MRPQLPQPKIQLVTKHYRVCQREFSMPIRCPRRHPTKRMKRTELRSRRPVKQNPLKHQHPRRHPTVPLKLPTFSRSQGRRYLVVLQRSRMLIQQGKRPPTQTRHRSHRHRPVQPPTYYPPRIPEILPATFRSSCTARVAFCHRTYYRILRGLSTMRRTFSKLRLPTIPRPSLEAHMIS